MYLWLDPRHTVTTTERLRDRIRERFPDTGLASVVNELVHVAKEQENRRDSIRRPSYGPRIAGLVALGAAITVTVIALGAVHPEVGDKWQLPDLLAAIEATVATVVYLAAALAFVWTLDSRKKRARCLDALHEMRAMAHIVDMHQLNKDPDQFLRPGADIQSSPKHHMTRFEMTRYLNYCSETLSLIGKVSALYVQDFPDRVALQAVNDIENLTTSLSRKIWQKIDLLHQPFGDPETEAADTAEAPDPNADTYSNA
ncbi:MAG: hypothetical protein VYE77_01425 [Planctomycetota bacterium]|nr:hypothetical protein [Planctomycetota bacterium]